MGSQATMQYQEIDFALVGPPKSGTTWLARCLGEHPAIFCAKENVHLTLSPYEEWAKWVRLFQDADKKTQALGDYATTYSYFPGMPARLSELKPNLKIVFTVRDPVERCLSSYKHDIRMGFIPRRYPFYRLIQPYFLRDRYIDAGCYSKHVARFLEHFPPEQIYLSPMPNLEQDNQPRLDDLCRFLGVHPRPLPSANDIVYETHNPLLPRVHRVAVHSRRFPKRIAQIVDPVNRRVGRRVLPDPVEPEHRNWVKQAFVDMDERTKFGDLADQHGLLGIPARRLGHFDTSHGGQNWTSDLSEVGHRGLTARDALGEPAAF